MRARLTYSILSMVTILLCLETVPAEAGEVAGDVIIETNDPSPFAGWDSGILGFSLDNPKGRPKNVKITFRGQRNHNLAYLQLLTSDWNFDASEYVRELPAPFPSRIGILMRWDQNGDIRDVDLEIPYYNMLIDQTSSQTPPMCMVLELVIGRGRVTQSSNHAETPIRCEQ
jgi:hypothetical protein